MCKLPKCARSHSSPLCNIIIYAPPVHVCACTRCVPGSASNCADISLSFASSLKPHDTCQRSQMAGCLSEMQTDDNEALSAVQSSAALSCSTLGYVIGRRGCCKHTHTQTNTCMGSGMQRMKPWRTARQTDSLLFISDARRWSREIRCSISDVACSLSPLKFNLLSRRSCGMQIRRLKC